METIVQCPALVAVNKLSLKKRNIIISYTEERQTVKEIADEMDLSRERIYQILRPMVNMAFCRKGRKNKKWKQ